jgi:YggT family protein
MPRAVRTFRIGSAALSRIGGQALRTALVQASHWPAVRSASGNPVGRHVHRAGFQGLAGGGQRSYSFPGRHQREQSMYLLLNFISDYIISTIKFLLILQVILSWLIAFGVVNPYNQAVRTVYEGLNAVFEPLLRPIRSILPNMGGLDFSPLVLFFALIFLDQVVIEYLKQNI